MVEGLSKTGQRTLEQGQECGDCWEEGGLKGLNGMEKYNKD